ncbi:MAG: flagellar biosynthesis anti-sigma factor FlgM [Bacillota bacterium]|nr:flagellar biosynthesis anti-sigma factor FlgM [Bacillota bacterium]
MKINGINTNNVISNYNNAKKKVEEKHVENQTDSLQISSAGRSLSNYADGIIKGENSTEKIERIKSQIANGTYTANAKLTAQKMIDIMKGRDI